MFAMFPLRWEMVIYHRSWSHLRSLNTQLSKLAVRAESPASPNCDQAVGLQERSFIKKPERELPVKECN